MITSEQQFHAWAQAGSNWVPVIKEILADLDTPLSLYLKLADEPYSYLFESKSNGETQGRYSFIGLSCHSRIIVKDNKVTYIKENQVCQEIVTEDPLSWIENFHQTFHTPPLPQFPPFVGGLVGYFGYETIRYIEPRLKQCDLVDVLNVPDIYLLVSQQFIIYDNNTNRINVVCYADPAEKNAYLHAVAALEAIEQKIYQSIAKLPPASELPDESSFESNFTVEDYEASVEKAREYFKAGDAMQLILSQRFSKKFTAAPISLYRALRLLNPSPYMFFLNLDNFCIVGASPEILVRLEQDTVTVRPLAGTRPRGKSKEEDIALQRDLLADPKEIAEHVMLIDLGRNDIGRVCVTGTVKVTEQMVVERFSHVMHISSTVVGQKIPSVTPIDVLRATFPAGTVSGAPKIRAMELIDELESEKRGIYAGAIGYLAWNGNLDMAIILRTAIIQDQTVYVQAGGGVVADSIPRMEWQECINKGRALFCAVELAENSFVECIHDNNDR